MSTVSVPVPILMNRNVVAMSLVSGGTLNTVILDEPERFFEELITHVTAAYNLGFIHGDLSEYNIMTDGEKPVLIDWPQWVPPTHTNADEVLEHDIRTVCQYFRRKYSLDVDPDEIRGDMIR